MEEFYQSTGSLDVSDNDLIVDYVGGAGNSSPIGAFNATGYGIITGSQTALWNGVAVDATTVIVKYTYAGDLNLDGLIDGADYGVIDNWV